MAERVLVMGRITVQPGVINSWVTRAVAGDGFYYAPDPSSQVVCSIGGNVAENSGGLRGLKYGVTRDYVMGLEVVLPDGRIARFGNACVKDVAGYSMKDLFIGVPVVLGRLPEEAESTIRRVAAASSTAVNSIVE